MHAVGWRVEIPTVSEPRCAGAMQLAAAHRASRVSHLCTATLLSGQRPAPAAPLLRHSGSGDMAISTRTMALAAVAGAGAALAGAALLRLRPTVTCRASATAAAPAYQSVPTPEPKKVTED